MNLNWEKINNFIKKYHVIIVIFLLLISSVLALYAADKDSETTDESVYIASSYQQLKYADLRFNPEHPPLAKYFTALPLLFIDINEPSRQNLLDEYGDYYHNGFWEIHLYGDDLLYYSGNNADQLIFLSRLSSIFFMLLLGWLIFKWVKEVVGVKAGLLSLILYLFNPLVLAMGHLATLDMASVFTMTLSMYLFYNYLKKSNYQNLIFASIGLGIALLTRYSNAYLAIFYVVWMLYQGFSNKKIGKYLLQIILMAIISYLILWIGYLAPLHGAPVFDASSTQITMGAEDGSSIYNQLLQKYAQYISPAYYFKGLMLTFDFFSDGHGSLAFIDGKYQVGGWWYYFPLAFLYKTPLYLLGLIFGFIYLIARYFKKYKNTFNLLILSALVMFGIFAIKSKMNLGVRYILPMYILAFIVLGQLLVMIKKKYQLYLGSLIIVGVVFSLMYIAPNYLTYFNPLAGGPQDGWKHLSDSNLDWGQDVERLSDYLKEQNIDKIYIDYAWKKAPLDYYAINYEQFDSGIHKQGYLVIGANSIYQNQELLSQYKLLTRLGNAIYVYQIQ